MKKVISILVIAVMLIAGIFVLTGCENNETTTDESASSGTEQKTSSGTAIKDITIDNWSSVVEENYGLSLSLPNGWEVTEAKSLNGSTNIKIVFKVDENFSYADFGQQIFDELKKDSNGDIYKYDTSGKVYSTFKEAGDGGIASFYAKVDGNSGKQVIVNYYNRQDSVELNLLRMGSWK